MQETALTQSIKKVVIIGPESTGKSTLAESLAGALDTVFVPEYARDYIDSLQRPYNEADLLEIAKGQLMLENALLPNAKNGWLVCDTDLYVIKVWSEHKYRRCDDYILKQIAERSYDIYLLTDIDLPWEYDPQREYPEQAMRRYFFDIYSDIVQQSGAAWHIISGNEEERLQKALRIVQQIVPL